MHIIEQSSGVLVTNCGIDLYKTFDCGQCFRFDTEDGKTFKGVTRGKQLTITVADNGFFVDKVTKDEFNNNYKSFFDLDRDYDEIRSQLKKSGLHSGAIECGKGIHILKQEPWETLCSFIISQNNNIPRIKKIINALCKLLGEEIEENVYAFPTPEKLASAGIDGLAPIRAGFRAGYLADAAKKVASGALVLDELYDTNLEETINALCTIKGVGPKVAGCVALFGLGHTDSFPIDVWIKRVIEKYYDADFSPTIFGKYAGIAQQYLFYHERYLSK